MRSRLRAGPQIKSRGHIFRHHTDPKISANPRHRIIDDFVMIKTPKPPKTRVNVALGGLTFESEARAALVVDYEVFDAFIDEIMIKMGRFPIIIGSSGVPSSVQWGERSSRAGENRRVTQSRLLDSSFHKDLTDLSKGVLKR